MYIDGFLVGSVDAWSQCSFMCIDCCLVGSVDVVGEEKGAGDVFVLDSLTLKVVIGLWCVDASDRQNVE